MSEAGASQLSAASKGGEIECVCLCVVFLCACVCRCLASTGSKVWFPWNREHLVTVEAPCASGLVFICHLTFSGLFTPQLVDCMSALIYLCVALVKCVCKTPPHELITSNVCIRCEFALK